MLRLSTVFGIIGAASVLTVAGHPLAKRSFEAIASTDTVHAPSVVKGDRLAVRSSIAPTAKLIPTSVEIVGSDSLSLIMRARDGSVVYSVDGSAGTTSIARNGELPAVTIKSGDAPASAPIAVPTSGPTAQETPAAPAARPIRAIRVGCEGAVSSLVSAEARRMLPGRCLV